MRFAGFSNPLLVQPGWGVMRGGWGWQRSLHIFAWARSLRLASSEPVAAFWPAHLIIWRLARRPPRVAELHPYCMAPYAPSPLLVSDGSHAVAG